MADIRHLLHIRSEKKSVFRAISTIQGLQSWWTVQTGGREAVGERLTFRFGDRYYNEMEVIALRPSTFAEWQCQIGADDWIGTHIRFHIDDYDDQCRLIFEHAGWREANDFYAHCNFSWGRYLQSLRTYCETGLGQPFSPEPSTSGKQI